MARDDFSSKVIEMLRSRVAGHCSNPSCDVSTLGPVGDDKLNNVGIAAHIHAASPGGPRYLEEMTRQQRKSLANGIWLCGVCSRDVDNDGVRYPAELLRDWKQRAEELARNRLGQKPLTQRDIQDQMKVVMGSASSSFQLGAIANVHLSLERGLEEIDPRFQVRTSRINGETLFEIGAKQHPVPMALRVDPHMEAEFREKMAQFFNHGESVSFDSGAATVVGSPLVEHLMPSPETTELRIEPRCIPSVLKVVAAHPQTGEPFFEEFRGDVVGGVQSLTFKGQACDGMVTISLRYFFAGPESGPDFSIAFNDALWAHKDVGYLPHFESIYQLFEAMSRGNDLDMRLLLQGLEVLHLKFSITGDDYVAGTSNALRYLKRARVVAAQLERKIRYMPAYLFSAEQHMDLHQVAQIAEGEMRTVEDPNAVATVILSEEVELADVTDPSRPHLIKFSQDKGALIDIYGQSVLLPLLEIALDNVFAEVLSEELSAQGRAVKVAWRPAKDFSCVYSYLKDSASSVTPSDVGR